MNKLISLLIMVCIGLSCYAQDIALPSPNKTGGKPLMDALNDRRTTREFSDKELDVQTLSDLLWAAYGFNRENMRVVPSANNKQEFTVYVVLKTGVYVYDAQENLLILKVSGDWREKAGKQDFVATAPLNLVYVADLKITSKETAGVDVGFIAQNVYLYCASVGLGTVVRGWFDGDEIKTAFGLDANQTPILTQTVGYKK
ncbi:MAG: SagB/ThcOx family dehydrogenase [Dysgonamonadaceae bacterium]|nr:SagB/ThcOx family dehydrogenase [Dysgonamonadaceae bacterium]